MTPIYVTRESLKEPTEWEVNGTSPANSPQAVMQMVQQLIPICGNPTLGPQSGLNLYDLVAAFLANGPLRNMKGVQLPKDEVERRIAAASASANLAGLLGAAPGAGTPGGLSLPPGGSGAPSA